MKKNPTMQDQFSVYERKGQQAKTLVLQKTFWEKRAQATERITSERGIHLRLCRSIQVEGAFALLKNDLPFYEVAAEKQVDEARLATGNKKHFPVQPFIVTAREFLEILNQKK